MAQFTRPDGARIFYEDQGAGAPVIALHGFSETSLYWTAPPCGPLLTEGFRLLAMDMRGHGRTRVAATAPGYDVETIAGDVEALAEHLGLGHYHLLAHATGSVVALRHAMGQPPRLASMILTSAASATAMVSPDPEENRTFFGRMARFYSRHDWPDILPRLRTKPRPFLHQLDKAANREQLWRQIEAVFTGCRPSELALFVDSFYDDPDPKIAQLRIIETPTLLITAEHDELMLEPSALLETNIPAITVERLMGVGHMTALEAPSDLAKLIVDYVSRAERQAYDQ